MTHRSQSNFFQDTRGNMSIIAGVVGVMLLTAVGASLDGGQMISTKQRLQSITDAAALMAASPEGVSAEKRKALAESSIRSHVARVGGIDVSETTITVNEAEGQVYVALVANVPLMFGGVLGSEMGRVSASSLAEESSAATASAASISLVLDLSDSMGDRFDTGSKIASVHSAVSDVFNMMQANFGSEAAAATQISTGVYPFNWGMVDGETVALQPGTNNVMTSLSYLTLGAGSVPTSAMEQAVEDQLKDAEENKARDRFIVYITDGKVEEDKKDEAGRYLKEKEMFGAKSSGKCIKMAKELAKLDVTLDPELAEAPGTGSSLAFGFGLPVNVEAALGFVPGETLPNGQPVPGKSMDKKLKGDRHAGHNHGNPKVVAMAERIELRNEFIEVCQPKQTIRVALACEKARTEGISVIAINLSGEDGIASNTADMCVNGFVMKEERGGKKRGRDNKDPKTAADDPQGSTRVLPSGIKVRVSADGKSYSGDATTLAELRDMLGSMLPAGKKERHVRLVG